MERPLRQVSFDTTDENRFDMNVRIISTETGTLLAHRSVGTGCPRTSCFKPRSIG